MPRAVRLLFALLALAPAAVRAASPGPEVWMGAMEPPWRAARGLPPNDYLDLFRPDAPWPTVAARLTEVELSRRFVLEAPPEMLAAVVADLGRRHVGIAMQVSALQPGKECGAGVEGYGPKDDSGHAALRLRRAGGALDAVVMDAPIWFGHFFAGSPGHPACQMPVAEAARQALAKIAQVRAVFPAVRIGETEPFGDAVPVHEFDQALVEWFADLTLATGHPIAFLQADMAWQRPGWQDALRSAAAFARTQRVGFGVIYNGGHVDTSDAAWADATRRHYTEVERRLDVAPEIAAFVSATPRPGRLLPETADDTLTGVVRGYLAFRAGKE